MDITSDDPDMMFLTEISESPTKAVQPVQRPSRPKKYVHLSSLFN